MASSRLKKEEHDVGAVEVHPKIRLSFWFVISFLFSILAAFFVGQLARRYILVQLFQKNLDSFLSLSNTSISSSSESLGYHGSSTTTNKGLPQPKVREDKEVPATVYTSKITDTAASSSAKTMILEKRRSPTHHHPNSGAWQECILDENYEALGKECQVSKATASQYKNDDNDDEEEEEEDDVSTTSPTTSTEELHMPAGQHLLVDIKDVNHEFLNSEQRLSQAMVDVVWESDLTLLSYHCHALFPMGVSCVGVLLESHISFHTWPEAGVITLDLFTCGSGLLIPILPLIERLFAVPQEPVLLDDGTTEEVEPPTMIWVHKLRGFRHENDPLERHLGSSNLAYEILGVMDMDLKKQVATVKTAFQIIDIWDVILPKFQSIESYKKSLRSDGSSYESNHPELYLPDRQVYLDGTMQSTRKGNEAYHEALVHPAMLAHDNPRRVAIIGGGEGATLREILKHKTLNHVKMIEIDGDMIETSRTYLPDWNLCDDIIGSTYSCFDDPRAEILPEDALAWFINRFSSKRTIDTSPEDRFDVIIMDALDPQDDVPFAEVLYSNFDFTEALFNALTDDGIIVMQLGQSPFHDNPPDELSQSRQRAKLINGLQEFGFQSMQTYEESHCGFGDPWTYLVVCKDYGCRKNWYRNAAEISVAIRNRLLPTVSGNPPLKYFDGATMQSYRPHKAYETIYCRRPNPAKECLSLVGGYNPLKPYVESEAFEVRESRNPVVNLRPMQGHKLGVFAKVNITKGTTILLGKSSNYINFYPTTSDLVYRTRDLLSGSVASIIQPIIFFMIGFTSQNYIYGSTGYFANSHMLSVLNHGCNGTQSILVSDPSCLNLTELTADPTKLPAGGSHYNSIGRFPSTQLFNPVVERHLPHLLGKYFIAQRDISAGEEIVDNYLTSISLQKDWEDVVKRLRNLCEEEYYTRANSCSSNR